jgi:MoxR-like ATPase
VLVRLGVKMGDDRMPTGIDNRQAAFSWLSGFLKDQGLQFSRSGFKGGDDIGKHTVDEAAGNWGNLQYSGNKPPRWLFHVDLTVAPPVGRLPGGVNEIGIGGSNTAQGDKAGLAVRILPLLQIGPDQFRRIDEFEANALFIFHGPLAGGSSSDAFSYNVATGQLLRSIDKEKRQEEFIFAALLALRPRTDMVAVEIGGANLDVTYGEVIDAIATAIQAHPKGGALGPIAVYDMSETKGFESLTVDIKTAWAAAGPPLVAAAAPAGEAADAAPEVADFENVEIPENPDLLGIDPAVYRQINAVLKSGKQHLMLYGPPGTGKTSLARHIAGSLPGGQWTLVTGSSDWSSQDIIGGYQPVGGGDVDFVPGILLRAFDQPFIIDELNRCDIDKVIGPLFTVLSGQQTTLPYRTDLSDKNSKPYTILPKPKAGTAEHEFAPGPAWRLIATINSIDKASLYQMSYALSRRFGWVYVDAPTDLAGFVAAFVAKTDPAAPDPAGQPCPLAEVWAAINQARAIGPAPFIDAIEAIRVLAPGASFFGPASPEMQQAAMDAIDMALLPMLDGIVLQDAHSIAETTVAAFGLAGADAERVRRRLEAVAI